MMISGPMQARGIGFKNVTIEDSNFHDNEMTGILVYGSYNNYNHKMKNAPLSADELLYAHANVSLRRITAFANYGLAKSRLQTMVNALPTPMPAAAQQNVNNKLLNGICAGSGILVGQVDGGLIEESIAYNNGSKNFSIYGPVGIWAFASTGIIIQRNESYLNRSLRADGGGFDLDIAVSNSILQYNYSHENDGAGYLMTSVPDQAPNINNIIRFNLSVNDGRQTNYQARMPQDAAEVWPGGIHLRNYVMQADVYHNTVYNSGNFSETWNATLGNGIRVSEASGGGIFIRNNIFAIKGANRPFIVLDPPSANWLPLNPGDGKIIFANNGYSNDGGRGLLIQWNGQQFTNFADFRSTAGQEVFSGTDLGYFGPVGIGNGTVSTGLTGKEIFQVPASHPLIGLAINSDAGGPANIGSIDFSGANLVDSYNSIGAFMYARSGFYRTASDGYYVNAVAHYCRFTSWNSWQSAGGPTDFSTVPYINLNSAYLFFDGDCN